MASRSPNITQSLEPEHPNPTFSSPIDAVQRFASSHSPSLNLQHHSPLQQPCHPFTSNFLCSSSTPTFTLSPCHPVICGSCVLVKPYRRITNRLVLSLMREFLLFPVLVIWVTPKFLLFSIFYNSLSNLTSLFLSPTVLSLRSLSIYLSLSLYPISPFSLSQSPSLSYHCSLSLSRTRFLLTVFSLSPSICFYHLSQILA